jgi:hypothetical protein
VIRTEVSSEDLADLAAAVRYEDDGKVLRRQLLQNLRKAVKPAADGAKASILSMPSGGLRQPGGGLRRAIAKQVKTEVKLSGKSAKVKVKVRRKDMPRGFKNAPKVVGQAGGWRHPSFPISKDGSRPWVRQVGKPDWFDGPMQRHRAEYRAAVKAAMDETAARIARKV